MGVVVALPGLVALIYTLRLIGACTFRSTTSRSIGVCCVRTLRPLGLLYTIVVLRTLTANSLSVFLPVLLTQQGMGVSEASAAVTAVSLRQQHRRLSRRSAAPTSTVHAASSSGRSWRRCRFSCSAQLASGWTLTVLVSIGGLFLQSTLPINVTFGQQIAPVSAATVSSLMMGFAWGVGSLLAPVVGLLGDRLGLQTTLAITAVVPLLAAMVAVPLPNRVRDAHAAPSPLTSEPE